MITFRNWILFYFSLACSSHRCRIWLWYRIRDCVVSSTANWSRSIPIRFGFRLRFGLFTCRFTRKYAICGETFLIARASFSFVFTSEKENWFRSSISFVLGLLIIWSWFRRIFICCSNLPLWSLQIWFWSCIYFFRIWEMLRLGYRFSSNLGNLLTYLYLFTMNTKTKRNCPS